MASAIAAIPTSRTSAVKCPCSLMMGGTRAPLRDARRLILGDRCLEIYPSDELSFPAERCIASPPERSTIMEGSAERYDALQRAGARRLTGFQRRLFLAEVAIELCEGRARNAERRFGWGRETVAKGLHELQHGMRCLENFAARGRQRSEQKDPQLAADIRSLVEPHTHADPELKSARRYTNLSAAEVRAALIEKGYSAGELPAERTMRDILNRMNYRLKRIQKGKPLKKTKQTNAIFANIKAVRGQVRDDPETLEIARDTKAKVALGEHVRGGKNPDRCHRGGAQGLRSRPAREGETGAARHPDGGQRGVDAVVRRARDQRRLGRCVAVVVAPGPGTPRARQTPGDLPGQRAEEPGPRHQDRDLT